MTQSDQLGICSTPKGKLLWEHRSRFVELTCFKHELRQRKNHCLLTTLLRFYLTEGGRGHSNSESMHRLVIQNWGGRDSGSVLFAGKITKLNGSAPSQHLCLENSRWSSGIITEVDLWLPGAYTHTNTQTHIHMHAHACTQEKEERQEKEVLRRNKTGESQKTDSTGRSSVCCRSLWPTQAPTVQTNFIRD